MNVAVGVAVSELCQARPSGQGTLVVSIAVQPGLVACLLK